MNTINGKTGDDILNDDAEALPEVSITAVAADKPEGDSGTTSFNFLVNRSSDDGESSVNWRASPLSPPSGNDFVGGIYPTGEVTFDPGESAAGSRHH